MQGLRCEPHGIYVDCTVGGGGHAEAILAATGPDGRFVGIDRDPEAIRLTGDGLERYGKRVRLFHGTFDQLEMFLRTLKIRGVDGILMDLGVSTLQLMDPARGFSFQQDGPLDMRMDPRSGETAADLVNSLPEQRLADILFEYGEERWARRISQAIAEERRKSPITRTIPLAQIIRRAIPRKAQSRRLHPDQSHTG